MIHANGELELPCGQCMDCKIRRSQDWATRATHEASLHESCCFLTLTFSEDGLGLRELQRGTHPFDLDMADWQNFAKRLRKAAGKFRFFQVGEYGEQELRPHYHALIFGKDFRGEGEEWKDELGHPAWVSRTVEKCWPYGFHEIKEATPESIAYVCKYVQKKLYGKRLENATQRVDCETGESVTVRPELASMSRRPGIGHGWWKKYRSDLFPDDFVILDGKKKPTPRYYLTQLEKEDEQAALEIKEKRKQSAALRAADNTPERRKTREKVTKGKLSLARTRKL